MTRPEDRGSGTPDRPLTDAQERALILLADRADDFMCGSVESAWLFKPCRDDRTITKLRDLGLVETRQHGYTLEQDAKITEAGLAMCRSMGD